MRTLCGYPADFAIEDARTGQFDLLTRAVMPPVATWLAARVATGIDRGAKLRRPIVTKVDLRKAPGITEDLTHLY